jgi:hypothetical protein
MIKVKHNPAIASHLIHTRASPPAAVFDDAAVTEGATAMPDTD